MKNYINSLMGLLALTLVLPISAATVVTYDDGSTLTLNEGESVYVTGEKLFKKVDYARGDVVFELQKPTATRDYVEPPAPIVSQYKGDHQWCLAYTPTGVITWDEVTFQRFCDTNDDGKYGCGDTQFDNSEDGDVCSSPS